MHRTASRLAIGLGLTLALCHPANAESHHWQLGVGSYGSRAGAEDWWSGFSDLERARMDWVFVLFGNDTTDAAILNRYYKINPNLKVLVRLWPISNLGQKENRGQATFLDYLYEPGVKEKLLAETTRQIRSILDGNDRPQNVVGFTFLEELPTHFTADETWDARELPLPWYFERYRKPIEAELGRPIVKWDESMRAWWGKRFVQVLNEINAHIKKESGGKLVFVYLQTNHRTMDWLEPGEPLAQPQVLPFHYRDVIQPGVADGFFAYPNNEWIWKRYLDLATKNNWPFFAQVAHPGAMRLSPWEQHVRLAQTNLPQNLGYFFHCEGHCRQDVWTDDPSIPLDENLRPASIRMHVRRFMALHKIGMDVIERGLAPELQAEYDSEKLQDGDWFGVNLFLRNVRDGSWFTEEKDAALRNVTLTLRLPDGFQIVPANSPPATVALGDLGPGAHTTVTWWAKAKPARRISAERPLRVTFAADNAPARTVTNTAARAMIEPAPTRLVKRSGERWFFPAWHLKNDNPLPTTITLECLDRTATNPSLTIGSGKVIWMGCLQKGQTLVLGPGRKATLKDAASPDGRDVSDRLGGDGVSIHGYRGNDILYTDDDAPAPADKLRITIEVRDAK